MNDRHFHDMYKYFSVIGIFNNRRRLKFDLTFLDLSRARRFFIFISSRILSKDTNIAKLNMQLVAFLYPKQHGRCLRKCSGDMLKWPTTKNTRDGCPLDLRPQNYAAEYHTADTVLRFLCSISFKMTWNVTLKLNLITKNRLILRFTNQWKQMNCVLGPKYPRSRFVYA